MKRYRLVACLLGVVCVAPRVSPAVATDPAQLVPHDAAVYVELSDASRIVDRFLAPDIVNTLETVPQFRQFTQSDQFAQLRAVVSKVEAKLGTEWRKAIGDLTGGGVVLAVRPGQPDFVLLIIRAKDAALLRRTHELLVEMVENDAKEKGRQSPVKSRDFKGVKAYSFGGEDFHAILGDTFVFSNKQEGLKTALELHAGEGPRAITELDLWKEARDRVPKDRVGWAFAKLDVFRQAGFAKQFYEEKAPNPAIPLLFGGLSHLLRNAPYAVASLQLNDERLSLRAELPRDNKRWPESLRGFYATKSGEEAAVPLRPARSIASLSFYRDFKSIWDVRDQLVSAEALPKLNELETNAGSILFGDREFSSEVLGQIEPRVRIVVAGQDFSRAKVVPEIKLPAAALVLELKHPEEFSDDLLIAFQSILGVANVGLGQQKQPRFMLTQEPYRGFRIDGARFLDRSAAKSAATGAHLRHNFSPACTIAGRYFVLGSTVEIVKDVVDSLGDINAPPQTTPHNILLQADMSQIIDVLAQNKEPLISQNMVSSGNTRDHAEQEISALLAVLGIIGKGEFTWTADAESMHADLRIDFAAPKKVTAK